eukprot:911158-Amphidinium_carterae.1
MQTPVPWIQDSWDEEEDQELLDYLAEHRPGVQVKGAGDMAEMSEESWQACSVLFADTSVVHSMLQCCFPASGMLKVYESCYPDEFAALYGRHIVQHTLDDLIELSADEQKKASSLVKYPMFVKPAGNSKVFDGCVLLQHHQLLQKRARIRED